MPPLDVSYVKEFSEAQCIERRYSILDLCAPNAFTILVGQREKLGAQQETLKGLLGGQNVRLEVFVMGVDFVLVLQEHDDLFREEIGQGLGGGLLIRPDQHILSPLPACVSDEEVEGMILAYLGRLKP